MHGLKLSTSACAHTGPQGTRFMDSVATWLRNWAKGKIEKDPRYAGVRVRYLMFSQCVLRAYEPGQRVLCGDVCGLMACGM